MKEAPSLTVLVPCFNEGATIGACLDALRAWVQAQSRSVDVVVIDDGSTDQTRTRATSHGFARVVSSHPAGGNRGKGTALRAGVAAARGEQIVFLDADLAVGPTQLPALLQALEAGADVAVGCRTIAGATIDQPQGPMRRWLGRLYLQTARWWLGLSVRDVTCGFKAFRADAATSVFDRTRARRWGIDAEVLYVSRRLGLDVREVPVRWVDGPTSRVRLWRDAPGSLLSLLGTRIRHRRVCAGS